MSFATIWVTLKLATLTTITLLVVGLPLAYWLSTTRLRGRFLIESLVTLPLVLPPTVLGFYLLMATGPESFVGRFYEQATGAVLPFSFAGILLGSVIYNIPFSIRPFTAAFDRTDRHLMEASWSLGESRWRTFWRVSLPLAWPGILTGVILTFTHSVGEFGVVLMIGGNIPGVTQTLSIAIYDDVQTLDYASAHRTAIWLVVFALSGLCLTHLLGRRGSGL